MICESINESCSSPNASFNITWAFDGAEGRIEAPSSRAGGHLAIEKFDSTSIVVRGVDRTGPTPGLTSVYSGSIHGNRIIGTIQWSWPGHPDYPADGTFAGMFQERAPAESDSVSAVNPTNSLPSELLVCENRSGCNAVWILKGSTGTGTWFARNSTRATLTILRLEPDYIVIRRTDSAGGGSATYAGSPRGDYYAGTIVYSRPDHPGESTGTWTATVPQTSCAEHPDLDPGDASQIGQYALMFKRDREALGCYTVAAKAGDSTAQAAVGLFYYQGRDAVPQDYAQALYWLRKAADQGVYSAQRTVAEMFAAGLGTPRDSVLAGIYSARANEQKHDLEKRQEQAERAADRTHRLLSSFVLGFTFGLVF